MLSDKTDENRLMSRRLEFEGKQYKTQLVKSQKKLKQANAEIDKLRKEIESLQIMTQIKLKHEFEHKDYLSSGTLSDSELEKRMFTDQGRKKRARSYLNKQKHNFIITNRNKNTLKKSTELPLIQQRAHSNLSKSSSSDKTSDTLVAEDAKQATEVKLPEQTKAALVETLVQNETEATGQVLPPDANDTLTNDAENIIEDLLVNSEEVKAELNKIYFKHSHISEAADVMNEDPFADLKTLLAEKQKNSNQAPFDLRTIVKIIKHNVNNGGAGDRNTILPKAKTPELSDRAKTLTPDSVKIPAAAANEERPASSKTRKSLSKRKSQSSKEHKAINVAYVEPVVHANKQLTRKPKVLDCSIKSPQHVANEYKVREAFLDTFCRQANSLKPTKRNSVSEALNLKTFTESCKHKLLAEMNAIDENVTD